MGRCASEMMCLITCTAIRVSARGAKLIVNKGSNDTDHVWRRTWNHLSNGQNLRRKGSRYTLSQGRRETIALRGSTCQQNGSATGNSKSASPRCVLKRDRPRLLIERFLDRMRPAPRGPGLGIKKLRGSAQEQRTTDTHYHNVFLGSREVDVGGYTSACHRQGLEFQAGTSQAILGLQQASSLQ